MSEIVKAESNTRVVEVNGIKMEVDMRYAKRIDHFRVGDRVRLLKKKGQYDSACRVLPGIIAGFEPFENLPTIIVATIETTYNEAKLEFFYINSESNEYEIVPAQDDFLPIEKAEVISKFDRDIEAAQRGIEALERKKRYFMNNFNKYFPETQAVERVEDNK